MLIFLEKCPIKQENLFRIKFFKDPFSNHGSSQINCLYCMILKFLYFCAINEIDEIMDM